MEWFYLILLLLVLALAYVGALAVVHVARRLLRPRRNPRYTAARLHATTRWACDEMDRASNEFLRQVYHRFRR